MPQQRFSLDSVIVHVVLGFAGEEKATTTLMTSFKCRQVFSYMTSPISGIQAAIC